MKDLHLAPRLYTLPKDTGRAILLHYYTGEPDFLFHYHPEFELVMTRGSRGRSLIGNRVANYGPLSLQLFGPNLPHTFAFETHVGARATMDNTVVHFTRESLGVELLEKRELQNISRLLHGATRGVDFTDPADVRAAETFMEQIVHLEGTGLPQFLTFLALLDMLAGGGHHAPIVAEDYDYTAIDREHLPFARVLAHIHEHGHEPLKLEDMAASVNMSVPTFCRFFRRMTGTTFVDYLNDWRIDRACFFLRESGEAVLDIALKVGFNNLSHFNRQFLRRRQVTPKAYRRLAMSDNGLGTV